MIPGFLNTTRQAGAHDDLDPEQRNAQAVLVEMRLREDSLQMTCDGNEGWNQSQ